MGGLSADEIYLAEARAQLRAQRVNRLWAGSSVAGLVILPTTLLLLPAWVDTDVTERTLYWTAAAAALAGIGAAQYFFTQASVCYQAARVALAKAANIRLRRERLREASRQGNAQATEEALTAFGTPDRGDVFTAEETPPELEHARLQRLLGPTAERSRKAGAIVGRGLPPCHQAGGRSAATALGPRATWMDFPIASAPKIARKAVPSSIFLA